MVQRLDATASMGTTGIDTAGMARRSARRMTRRGGQPVGTRSVTSRRYRAITSALLASFLCGIADAHHSHGNYAATFMDIEGVVSEVLLINPHSWIYLEVEAEGGPELWSLEASSRTLLERIGIEDGDLAPGDAIKVRCHPLRDGSRGCLLGFVKTADGTITDWDGTNLPKPEDL